jgi:hypothetical protein
MIDPALKLWWQKWWVFIPVSYVLWILGLGVLGYYFGWDIENLAILVWMCFIMSIVIRFYNKKRKDQKKQWALDNKDKVNESRKKWTDSNKEKRKEYVKEYNKRYYQLNLEKRREYSKVKQKEYRQTNDLYRIKSNLRRRINRYIKKKSKSTEDILGINYIDFLIYIQSKFTDGMSIEKLGNEIHIDHIVPLSSAKSEEELYKLCRYTNLQPLWAKDNLSKSDKLFKLRLIYNQ